MIAFKTRYRSLVTHHLPSTQGGSVLREVNHSLLIVGTVGMQVGCAHASSAIGSREFYVAWGSTRHNEKRLLSIKAVARKGGTRRLSCCQVAYFLARRRSQLVYGIVVCRLLGEANQLSIQLGSLTTQRYELHLAVQARRYKRPLVILHIAYTGVTVDNVEDVHIFEDAPRSAVDVHLTNAVGRQIGHFDTQCVVTLMQQPGDVELEGSAPCAASIHIIYIYARTLTHIAQTD